MISNTSIFFFTQKSNFLCPLLANSRAFSRSNFFMKDSSVSKSFFSVLYSFSLFGSYYIRNTKFKEILDSSVVFSNLEISKTFITESYRDKPEEDLYFSHCVFHKITSNTNGGAIRLNSYRFTLNISHCGFSLCMAHQSGGAISFYGYQFVSKFSCYYGCLAIQSEQAICSDLKKISNDEPVENSLNYSLVSQCSPSGSKGASRAIFFSSGMQQFCYVNWSNNHVNEESAVLISSFPIEFMLLFSDISKSSGTNLLWLHKIDIVHALSFVNIHNNTNAPDNAILTIEQSNAVLNSFIFSKNIGYKYIEGTFKAFLRACIFDVQFSQSLFFDIQIINEGSHFGGKAKIHQIEFIDTWSCWAIGSISPKPTSLIQSYLNYKERSLSIVLIVLITTVILSYIIWIIMAKKNLGDLQPVVIQN